MDLLKIGIVLVTVMGLLRKRIHMGAVMTIGATLMALLFQLPLLTFSQVALETVIQPSTLQTALALLLIMILENLMRKNKLLENLVAALKKMIKDYRAVLPLPPAFLGLLPSAGGALFSAPMVSDACGSERLSSERKGLINFWYRHIWECVLPLYPAMIIATEIMGVEMASFISRTYPFTILAIILGLPYLFFRIKKSDPLECEPNASGDGQFGNQTTPVAVLKDLLKGIVPILSVLLLFFLLEYTLAVSLGIVILALIAWTRLSPSKWPKLLREAVSLKILAILFGIMFFKNILESSGAVHALVDSFSSWGVSLTLLAILFPFAVGFLTGMSQAYVAIAFPILLGMTAEVDLSLMALAYVSGFAGLMLSPMHLCLVLTSEFFHARMDRMIFMMTPPLGVMVGVGWLLTTL